MSAISWVLLEWILKQQLPSCFGLISGAVAGLVAITPACGWVDQTGAFFIGCIAGPFCYLCEQLKQLAGYKDELDAFGVHATGGLLGGLLTGFFASPIFFGPFTSDGSFPSIRPDNPNTPYYAGVFYAIDNKDQFAQLGIQAYGCFVTILYSTVTTAVLLKLVDVFVGVAAPEGDAITELDASLHGNSVMMLPLPNEQD
jgi:Amt family ammonium transporter